jgi:gamma-D-glutamyl-L-lysine dipeptidyl-peptidase
MRPRPFPSAVVAIAALDLRRHPGHAHEMRSQLLLGEVVDVLDVSRDGQWWDVRNRADGYRGWARNWGLTGVSASRARSWLRHANARVIQPVATIQARPGAGAAVGPLFFNSRLIAGPKRGRHLPVELPDGRRGWVEARVLALGERKAPPSLTARIQGLLGVPYLWGGRTPLGYDCSGFTQQVLAEQGISLPRDAQHQERATRRLRRGELPSEGDLVFFGPRRGSAAHVGLGLGGGYFVHARGRVRISSIDPDNPLCDSELSGSMRAWRRP